MPDAAPPARLGKYAAGLKNPHPADSERQPRNASWHNEKEATGLINAAPAMKKRRRVMRRKK